MKNDGWKDEFWTVIIALPLILAFTPGAQDFVSRGFAIMTTSAPSWYVSAVGAAVGWAFGKRIVPPRK